MTRTVFYGFGAFVGNLRGVTECDFWPGDPNGLGWAATALIPVDLSKNPQAAAAGHIKIDDIQVDDHRSDGGLTTIGPRFPGGAPIGAVWLSEAHYKANSHKLPRDPNCHDYETTSILYWSNGSPAKRYFGFHAKIDAANNKLARVAIWSGGTHRSGHNPAGTWWVDLADPDIVDPMTQISTGGQQEGALFLDAATSRSLTLAWTKQPPGFGFDVAP